MGTQPGAPLLQLAGDALTQRILDSVADGVLAFDSQCRYTLWNPAMERISGVPASAVLGRVAFEVFPFLIETGEDRCFREALAGRTCSSKDQSFDVPESGRRGTFEGHYSPLHDANGNTIGGIAIIRDVTEKRAEEEKRLHFARAEAARVVAEAAAQRSAFLAEAGEVLASSLDYEQTLRTLAKLAIGPLGDLCIVDFVEDGVIRRVGYAHAKPEKAALLDELWLRFPPTPASPQPAARVARTGEAELLRHVDMAVIIDHTMNPEHADLIRRIDMRSHLAVPVIARGRIVGVISMGITESDRRFDEDDLALASDLARRAALAVDNALLYRAAQMSERRFRAVFEQSPLSTQLFTRDGTTTRVNAAWEKLLGVKLEMIEGYNVLKDPQLDVLGITPLLHRAVNGEAVAIPASRYEPSPDLPKLTVKPTPELWVRAFAYPIKDADGTVREVVLVHEDVSATIMATERVRASEERLRIALEAARMCVWDVDLVTGRMEVSENARDIYGIDRGNVEDFTNLIHPDDRARVQPLQEGGDTYQVEYRLLGRDGGPDRWVQSRGRVERDADQRIHRARGVTVDITARKAAENATAVLADAGETLNASLDANATLRELARVVVPRLADWCVVDLVDEHGELQRLTIEHHDPEVAREALELYREYPPLRPSRIEIDRCVETREPIFQPELTLDVMASYAIDERHRERLARFQLRSRITVPLVVRDKGIGALTLAQAESRRRYTEDDLAVAIDLAHRAAAAVENAQLYERLREEDRRKDEFLATLAHELRNPLAPVRTALDVLRATDTSRSSIHAMMERQLGHMTRLIDDLLDVSRVSRGKIELQRSMLSVEQLVQHALEVSEPMLETANLSLKVEIRAKDLVVEGDPTRLALVLSNLLNNAAKFTPRGGRVTLSVERVAEEVELRLTDTGIGIPRDMLARVFEMFLQVGKEHAAQGGLGIGLTMVRRLVELHGGRVWAESEGEGRGSTFVVRLPLASAEASVAIAEPPEASPPLVSRRILVVDDNVDAAKMLAILLELDHHVVRRAASGKEALEILREFKAEIALLDIGLPGMSGLDLARAIRSDASHDGMLLVAVTGWGQEDDLRRSREAGFDRHLTKPTSAEELAAVIDSLSRPH